MIRNLLVANALAVFSLAIGCGSDPIAPLPAPQSPFSKEAFELAAAVNNGDSKELSSIIARNVNPFIVMGDGTTVLHGACAISQSECVIELLMVADSSEVNRQDIHGQTPLHHAVNSNSANTQIVKYLLEAGADPAIEDAEGLLPVDHAQNNGRSEMVKLLKAVE